MQNSPVRIEAYNTISSPEPRRVLVLDDANEHVHSTMTSPSAWPKGDAIKSPISLSENEKLVLKNRIKQLIEEEEKEQGQLSPPPSPEIVRRQNVAILERLLQEIRSEEPTLFIHMHSPERNRKKKQVQKKEKKRTSEEDAPKDSSASSQQVAEPVVEVTSDISQTCETNESIALTENEQNQSTESCRPQYLEDAWQDYDHHDSQTNSTENLEPEADVQRDQVDEEQQHDFGSSSCGDASETSVDATLQDVPHLEMACEEPIHNPNVDVTESDVDSQQHSNQSLSKFDLLIGSIRQSIVTTKEVAPMLEHENEPVQQEHEQAVADTEQTIENDQQS